jgi:serine/threonine protein kinase
MVGDSKQPPPKTSSHFHPHAASSSISDYLDASRTNRTGGFVGLGGSSTVSSEKNEETGEETAVKRFFSEAFDQTRFIREVETLVQLNHPCVLRIYGWKLPIKQEPAEIRTGLAVNGSLKDIMEKVGYGTHIPFWNPTGKGILICGIALGMRFIHSKGIIHADLKPSNVLVNGRGEALISDFGLSRFECNDYTLTPEGGTVNYAAPELFQEGAIPTRQLDVYAFGLLLYEILTGLAVFPSSEYTFPIVRQILSGEMPAVPDECGSMMQDLIPRCWRIAPETRPTFDDVIRIFKAAEYRIVPRSDEVKLRVFIEDIERWEADEAVHLKSK